MYDKTVSRRAFLALGTAAAVTAGAMTSGCAPGQQGTSEPLAAAGSGAEDIQWTQETDVVVVGFGGAGGAAAIEAARGGAEVVLLEELDQAGGSTAACGGSILMAATPLQKKFNIEDSTEAFYAYMCAAGGGAANEEALKVLCDFSPDLYDWCVGCGMDFESGDLYPGAHINSFNKTGYTLFYTGNEQARAYARVTPPVPRGHSSLPGSSGKDIFDALVATVDSLGVQVMTGTPGKRLVQDERGRVVGIIAGAKDDVAIRARKAVILTAGGFGNNEKMMAEHYVYPNPRGAGIISAGNDNGTGILMGQSVGAATFGMGSFQLGRPLSTMGDALARGLIMGESGRRLVAEDEYNTFVGKAVGLALTERCFAVYDEAARTEGAPENFLGDPVAICGSLAEVAEAIGADADVVASTFAFYNESASLGEDREFGKDPQFMIPFKEGPFSVYACGSESCMVGSLGGLKIDVDAHVLDLSDEIIPGLYAAGRNSGSIFGWYMGSGASVADVLTFGIIAGRNASQESIEA